MGIGHALFLVDPEHPKVKELEVFEPVEAVTEPTNLPEADAGARTGPHTKPSSDENLFTACGVVAALKCCNPVNILDKEEIAQAACSFLLDGFMASGKGD